MFLSCWFISMYFVFFRCISAAQSICASAPYPLRNVLICVPAALIRDQWLAVCSPRVTPSAQDPLALWSQLLHQKQLSLLHQLPPLLRPLIVVRCCPLNKPPSLCFSFGIIHDIKYQSADLWIPLFATEVCNVYLQEKPFLNLWIFCERRFILEENTEHWLIWSCLIFITSWCGNQDHCFGPYSY